jgi:small ligand-binding sensory domain FIST
VGVKWASAISERPGVEPAFAEVSQALEGQLAGARPDLILAFAAPVLAAAAELPERVHSKWPDACFVGCSGAGVIGAGREVEHRPALSLVAASLPGVRLRPFHLDTLELPQEASAETWWKLLGVQPEPTPHFLLLADPFTCDSEALVGALDRLYPKSLKFGGLASGGRSVGSHRLFGCGQTWRSGAVGLAMSGALEVHTLVSQGCRPLGTPLLITRCRDNLLQELGGRAPIEVLRELLASLSEDERTQASGSVFVGLEMKRAEVEFHPGELLVRNLVGIEQRTGALAVGAHLEPYQVAQFVMRDARTATEDLAAHFKRYRAEHPARPPDGALLFSCTGRGEHLFGGADHDTKMFREMMGPVALGGFFCNGEIGPVGGTTFLHGQTSSFALFSSTR